MSSQKNLSQIDVKQILVHELSLISKKNAQMPCLDADLKER